MRLILASGSPRRRELLGQMGLGEFTVISPDIDESVWKDLPPGQQVRTLSASKAAAVAARQEGAMVIAADTVVVLDGLVLGKPRDREDAIRMLTALSGRRHEVYTGVTVTKDNVTLTEHEITRVTFRLLSREEISHYVDTGEPMDKAGAYGIQRFGALLVEGIEGDYFNVMGLPVCRLGRMLTEFGIDCLALAAKDA
ncbi:Septum formation protein Maf [bioreactor metagenome]|uniref:Septum formation protein Maf n=1 Tax=bioreactor metagenome TaxID=1076179 RepID=A0A644XZY1_9ZZZZ